VPSRIDCQTALERSDSETQESEYPEGKMHDRDTVRIQAIIQALSLTTIQSFRSMGAVSRTPEPDVSSGLSGKRRRVLPIYDVIFDPSGHFGRSIHVLQLSGNRHAWSRNWETRYITVLLLLWTDRLECHRCQESDRLVMIQPASFSMGYFVRNTSQSSCLFYSQAYFMPYGGGRWRMLSLRRSPLNSAMLKTAVVISFGAHSDFH
jgi:hypothetical protein